MKASSLGLRTRIFLASAGIVTLVLALALAVTQFSAQRAAQASIKRGLETTQERVMDIVSFERSVLTGRLDSYADNAVYRGSLETQDYLDYVEGAVEQSGADWAQLVSREGLRLAKSDQPGLPNDTLLGSPLVRTALDGAVSEAFGVAGDSSLIQIVAVPIKVPTEGNKFRILGALMGAKYITDSLARAIGEQTQSDVLFYWIDRNNELQPVAMTDGLRRSSAALVAALSQRVHTDTTSVQPAGRETSDTTLIVPGTEQYEVGGEHWVGRRGWLTNASGTPVGGFLALRSLEDELAATGYTALRNTLLLAGGGGLLLALLISVLTARQVARPVTVLAEATRRAAEGDYKAEIPEGGSDEIGTLASAFRRLLADLKDKQALVDFLSASAPGGTRMQTLVGANPAYASTLKIPTGAAGVNVLAPGQTFGNRYEIKSVLGVGGMGMVYKANDKELGEILAIKTLKPDMTASDSNALERFKSEIKLARRIAHRNVVRTYDLGEIGGQYYITMEYVEGTSLKDLIKERGRLPASVVLPIAKQLCRALEVSHDEGVIHRDIKPQNMVVQGDGVLKVMDFGIARLATRPKESGHTEAGMVVGTPEYMAPEQLMGDELDARADLYATGIVLYECLVGTVPITANTPIQLIARVLDETPRTPRDVKPDIPQALSDLVMWALAKDREKRPRSAAELHARLDAIVLS